MVRNNEAATAKHGVILRYWRPTQESAIKLLKELDECLNIENSLGLSIPKSS